MLKYRDFKETDRDYVTRSFLFSFLGNSSEAKKINKDSYMVGQNKVINHLIDTSKVLIACDDQDEDLILGFMIYDNFPLADVLHYCYLRKDFRQNGIVHLMIKQIQKSDSLAISHITDEIRPARLKKFWNKVIFDPFLTWK